MGPIDIWVFIIYMGTGTYNKSFIIYVGTIILWVILYYKSCFIEQAYQSLPHYHHEIANDDGSIDIHDSKLVCLVLLVSLTLAKT
jgi:hypothetical protein